VNECLRIVLGRAPWLLVAQRDEELKATLREALSGSPEVQERLDAAPPAAGGESDPAKPEAGAPTKSAGIKQQLESGCSVMRRFGWEFPRDPVSTKLDEATAGFQSFFEGITVLTTPTGRASVGPDLSMVFADVQDDWANILQFLLSMYSSGVRTTYTSRIRFVVVNLRAFSPAFRALMHWRSLPWGQEPMPAEEVKEEEERECRRHLEEGDHRLARELQAEEEARVRAEEEATRRFVEEDSQVARQLQEAMNVTPQPQRRPGGVKATGK